MIIPPAYFSLARPSRSLTYVFAHVFGVRSADDGIDFARVGGILGVASGILGFVIGQVLIAIGMLGVVGGAFSVLVTSVFGVIAGGVLGVAFGGAVGAVSTGIFLRDWNFRASLSVRVTRAAGCDAGAAANSLIATAPCWMMRLASRLMPRAAGRRWLAEAESFLFEAPAGLRRRAIRDYLVTAPLVISMSWTDALARQARLTASRSADRQSNASGDPSS